MSVEYSFFDNQLIGVDDLNKITSRILSQGVARQPSNVSDLNGFVSDVVTDGIIMSSDSSLKVSVSQDRAVIAPGTAFFANGTSITLTASESLDFEQGKKQYVYLVSDNTMNRAYPMIFDSEPENENTVLLAVINEDKTVDDKRYYARGKTAYYANSTPDNNVILDKMKINKSITKDSDGYYTYTLGINPNIYRYLNIYALEGAGFLRYDLKTKTKVFNFFPGDASYCYVYANGTGNAGSKTGLAGLYQHCEWTVQNITFNDDSITFKINFFKGLGVESVIDLSLRFEFVV